ncbi:DoxX family protein [Spirosoma pomorum]
METRVISKQTSSKGWHITLWVLQVLLALAFGMAGFMKLTVPIAELAKQMLWTAQVPIGLVRFIGVAELAGALGLILPALTRIRPSLTGLAAGGLALVMVLAAGFHLTRGEMGMAVPSVVLGVLAGIVVWGRAEKAPIYAN